jgi:hypothetical protein
MMPADCRPERVLGRYYFLKKTEHYRFEFPAQHHFEQVPDHYYSR